METPFAIYDALSAINVPPEKVRSVVQSLEHDMAMFATRTQFDQLDRFSASRIDLLRAEFHTEIKGIRERLDQMDKRFDALEKQIETRFVAVQAHIENRLTSRMGAMLAGAVALLVGLMQVLPRP